MAGEQWEVGAARRKRLTVAAKRPILFYEIGMKRVSKMTYSGHVREGLIVLDEPADLPDGAAVVIGVTSMRHVAERTEESATGNGEEWIQKLHPDVREMMGRFPSNENLDQARMRRFC